MNEQLQIIDQREVLGKNLTIYGDFENPLFLAADVAKWIEYAPDKVGQMLNTVDDREKLTATMYRSGQNREMWFLTEDGLYEILMQSRKPIAKAVKFEVKLILKQIRKTGAYIAPNVSISAPRSANPNAVLIEQLKVAKELSKITKIKRDACYLAGVFQAEQITGEDFSGWKTLIFEANNAK